MEKSRLETVKEEAKSKVNESFFNTLEESLNRIKLPSNVEIKVWKDLIDDPEGKQAGSFIGNARNLRKTEEEYDKFLEGIEADIEKRGKEAILYILDNVVDISEPRLKKILSSHKDLIMEVKTDNKLK